MHEPATQSAVCFTLLILRRCVRGAQARLKPFTWAAHYAPTHGPIAEFLRKHVSTFYFRDDGAVFVPDPPARPSRASSQGAHLHPAVCEKKGGQGRDTVGGPSGRPLRASWQDAHLRPSVCFAGCGVRVGVRVGYFRPQYGPAIRCLYMAWHGSIGWWGHCDMLRSLAECVKDCYMANVGQLRTAKGPAICLQTAGPQSCTRSETVTAKA